MMDTGKNGNRGNSTRRPTGFTLVELLVVIGPCRAIRYRGDPHPFGLSCSEIVTRAGGCSNPARPDLWEPWVASQPGPPSQKLGLQSRK